MGRKEPNTSSNLLKEACWNRAHDTLNKSYFNCLDTCKNENIKLPLKLKKKCSEICEISNKIISYVVLEHCGITIVIDKSNTIIISFEKETVRIGEKMLKIN